MGDNVNHPKHYAEQCSLECIEAMEIAFGEEAVEGYCLCNAFKYLWRYTNKGGSEDLRKALWYVKRYEKFYSGVKFRDEQADMLEKTILSKMEKLDSPTR